MANYKDLFKQSFSGQAGTAVAETPQFQGGGTDIGTMLQGGSGVQLQNTVKPEQLQPAAKTEQVQPAANYKEIFKQGFQKTLPVKSTPQYEFPVEAVIKLATQPLNIIPQPKILNVVGANNTLSPTPSPAEQRAQEIVKFTNTSTGDLLKQEYGDNFKTKIGGFFLNLVDPVAKTLSSAKIASDIKEEVAAGRIDSRVYDGIEDLHKSNLQVLGDAAQVGLLVAPVMTTEAALAEGGKMFISQGLKSALIDLAKIGVKEGAAQGFSFGVAQALSSGSTDPKFITKIIITNTGGGAVLGGVVTPALPLAGFLAKKGTQKTIAAISKVIGEVNKAQETLTQRLIAEGVDKETALAIAKQGGYLNLATKVNPRAEQAAEQLNKMNERFVNKPTLANKKAFESAKELYLKESQGGFVDTKAVAQDVKKYVVPKIEKVVETGKNLKTEFIDRYAPIQDLVKDVKLTAEADPYIAARNYAGHVGKIENRLNELSDVLKPHKDILPDVKEYALLDRYQELAGRGITKFPDNLTPETIASKKTVLEAKLGPDGMAKVNEALTGIRAYNDKLLTEAKDAGIISQESFNAIKKNNEKYIPLQRLDYLAEQADNIPRGSNGFSVATQNLVKTIKGSERAVADPIESMVRNTYNTVNLIERNKVAQKIGDLANLAEFKDIVIPLKNAEKIVAPKIETPAVITAKKRIIKLLDGKTPAEVKQLFKTMPGLQDMFPDGKLELIKPPIPKNDVVPFGMEKISAFRNGIKEEYAVPKNVGEALKGLNAQSTDLITSWAKKSSAMLRAGATSLNVGFIPSNAIRDFQTATIVSKVGFTPLDWLKGFGEAIKRGDDYKAFLESGGSSGFFEAQKSLPKTVKKLTENKAITVAKTVLNPVELLRLAGETIELAPRLGVFKKSLAKGLGSTEAAFNARNATVDFAKAGNTMKVLNQWVPFLNARLQGTLNMFAAIKDKPIWSALKLSALVGVPAITTYLNNAKRFPAIWNDISNVDKRNNFIIIYGDDVDDKGNPTQAIKIPKGDAKIFSNPLENFLSYLDKTNPKSLQQLATEVGSDISPVSFEDKGKFSPRTLIGGLLPPAIKGGVESITNKNLYTGYDIVPQSMINASPREQYDKNTSLLAKELGKFLNWSPKKIDNFIRTQFGALGSQITNPSKAGQQITNRFKGAYGGQTSQDIADEAQKAVEAQANKKLEMKRRAQTLLDRFSAESPEQAADDFESIAKNDSALAKEITRLKEQQDLGFTNVDYIIQDLQVENGERAKFLAGQFSKLKSKEEKAALWDDLVKKKLITKAVADQMGKLLK